MSNSGRVFNVNCATRTTDLGAFPTYHIYSCGDIVSNYPSSVKNYSISWKAAKILSWVIQWPPRKRSWLGSIPSTIYLWYPKSQGAVLVLCRDKNVRRKHTETTNTPTESAWQKREIHASKSMKAQGREKLCQATCRNFMKMVAFQAYVTLSAHVLIQWQFCRVALEISWKEIKK